MGLDSVELVMEVEHAFGISIADEDAQEIRTVGDLHQLVVGMLPLPRERTCLGARVFHRVRRDLMERGVPRHEVRLDARCEKLDPRGTPGALRVQLPRGKGHTVRDVVREMRATQFARLAAEEGAWHPSDVWDAIVVIVKRQSGVDERRIRPWARIVDDLGID